MKCYLGCGEWPDLRLARNAIIEAIQPTEFIIADRGYNDAQYFDFVPNLQKKRILVRHETVNRRIKQFSCMSHRFRPEIREMGHSMESPP